jgi:hypothetical protein
VENIIQQIEEEGKTLFAKDREWLPRHASRNELSRASQ